MFSNHCKTVEDYGQEIKEKMIIEMIKKGLAFEMIAEIAKLSVETIKKIAEKVAVKA